MKKHEQYKRQRQGLSNPNHYEYTPCLTKAELEEFGIIDVIKDSDAPFGWRVLRDNDREWKIIYAVTQRFNNGSHKGYAFVTLYNAKTKQQKAIALSRLLYVWFIRDIPKGYVVDHIDNNELNNDLDNLQLLTRSDNTKKNSVKHNQYTKNENLVHKGI